MSLTHYGTLGVDRAASMEEIKAGYRAKAAKAHPDRGGSHDEMAALTVAYRVLSNLMTRHMYNETLLLLGAQCTKCDGGGRTYKQKGFTTRIGTTCPQCSGEGVTAMKATKVSLLEVQRTAKRRKT